MSQLQGIFFKNVIGGMLNSTSSLLFPHHKEKIEKMDDLQWYEWDEFCAMTREIGAKVGEVVMQKLGRNVVHGAKELFASQGLNSTENILKNLNTLFMGAVRNAPKWQRFETVSYKEGEAVCETTVPQPIALIEGYLQGYVTMYGHRIKSLTTEEVSGREHPTHRITVTWKA